MQRAILFLAVFLTACQTSNPKLPSSSDLLTENQPLWLNGTDYFADNSLNAARLAHWKYSAKVAVVVKGKSQQANLSWQQQNTANTVSLFGPLGSGAVKIEFDQSSASITNNKGQQYQSRDAQSLINDIVGWPLPVKSLQYWLFALPEPNASYQYQLDAEQQVAVLQQHGWTVTYKDWRYYQGQKLPRKVFAHRRFEANENFQHKDKQKELNIRSVPTVSVKLITKSWVFDAND